MRQPKIVIIGAGLVGGSAALFTGVAIPSAQIVIIRRRVALLFMRLPGKRTLGLGDGLAIWLVIGPLGWLMLGPI